MERNWAGNLRYSARRHHVPESLDDLRRIVSRATSVRVVGTRHSFNDIADADELMSLHRMPGGPIGQQDGTLVEVRPWWTYTHLAHALSALDLALPAMASLPHISVGGAIATATHGSGDAVGNLATVVRGMTIVSCDGDLIKVDAREDDQAFAGMPVNLGALGVVTSVVIAAVPAYEVAQVVYERLSWSAVEEHFDELMAVAYGVSLFTDYREGITSAWLQFRADDPRLGDADATLFGGRRAQHDVHPVPTLSAQNCTVQRGVPGPWHSRLPHFRPEFTPASGAELQSEYLVPRAMAVDALQAIRAIEPRIRDVLMISEVRSVAADSLWMSTAEGGDRIGIHLTWHPMPEMVEPAIDLVEAALAPFAPRPHWGKLFHSTARDLAPRYTKWDAFHRLREDLDYRGAFRNRWTERVLG